MSEDTKLWLRFGIGAYLAYLGISGLLRPELTTGDIILRVIQLFVAVYAVWTGVNTFRHRNDPAPEPPHLEEPLLGEVEALVAKGEEVRAIKLVRERTGAALVPARDAVTAVAARTRD